MASSNGRYVVFAMKAMADITGTLLLPALAAFLLQKLYQDASYSRTLFLVSLAVALLLSLLLVVRKAQRYGKAYQELLKTSDSTVESRGPGG